VSVDMNWEGSTPNPPAIPTLRLGGEGRGDKTSPSQLLEVWGTPLYSPMRSSIPASERMLQPVAY